jgi:hypothetical protein
MVAQAATRAVVADISAAQSETIAQQQPMFVVFQPSENRYKLITDQNKVFSEQWNSAAGSGWVDFDENGRFQGVKLVSAELSGSALPSKGDYPAERVVKFSALGSPDSGGTIKLEYNGHPYVIDLAAFTGRVTVRRENG